ncbi:aminodeoxychorismate lyase [Acetobacter pomorum]|uniref:Endolytic murein transglycosylase n=1 Tax=Acetobacter pomorum TaxID=65959 RepID=A0A2G4RD35_9PROT|nr:endolytic transglycosylase MltG [Acetobacter pomorum]PHY93645.1 aminodeoxychorismate lyase [Acetobacter pomorum]
MASKPKKKPAKQPARKGRAALKWLGSLFLLSALAGGGTGFFAWYTYIQPGPLVEATDVVVPHGNYASTLAALQQAQVLPSGWLTDKLFVTAISLTRKDGQLHAAELHFPQHVSMQNVLFILRHGKPVLHKLTIPEGLSAHQIQALIATAPFLNGDTPLPAEGSTLPQTYNYLRNSTRAELVKRAQNAMQVALATVWQKRDSAIDGILPSPQILLVLASLIEKETALPAERPVVARVFLNRLQKGMKLQTDPTVIYAITHGNPPLGRALTRTDLATPDPYNTYVVTGLPPGPICSPGLSSLEAAAHPASGDALFFVANGNGGHNFSTTLAEHNRNVSVFRQHNTH